MRAQCHVLISPVRREGAEQSEMISQMLYGETCSVLESEGGFSKIKMNFDGVEGWVQSLHIQEVNAGQTKNTVEEPFGVYDLPEGRSLLSIGSEVVFDTEKTADPEIPRNTIATISRKFLNVPYLWGGRSFFGVDADGFVQLVFKVHQIFLPRSAEKMAEVGEVVDFLGESEAGDLAFFENEDGKIRHVGIMLNSYEVIHAFGKVRIDALDSSGIYSAELKKHTHKLRFIRRIL